MMAIFSKWMPFFKMKIVYKNKYSQLKCCVDDYLDQACFEVLVKAAHCRQCCLILAVR